MRTAILFILATFQTSFAGFEHREVGARSRALGGAYIGLANDVWAMKYNAGGLSQLTMNEVSCYYSPQPFGLSELSFGAVAVGLPTNLGVVGLSASKYGFDLYKELAVSVSFARQIADVGIGISLSYYSVSILNYGSAGTIGIDVGVYIPIISQLTTGLAISNINAPAIGTAREKLPQMFSVGVVYSTLQSLNIVVDYRKETGYDASPKIGFEYWVMESVALRGGMADEPSQSSGGVGFKYAFVQMDYALSRHQDLGWSHQASITLRW